MISKKTRRSTKAVEPLTQFPITAEKGIDISKSADNLNTVQELENFDITTSGDLELRKPMLVKQTFPATNTEKVLKVFPLYNPNYRLVVYINPTNNRTWIRIVDAENNVQPLRYSWSNYFTEEEYTQTLTEQTLLSAEKVPFDWSGTQLSSLSTASVCTNVRVDVCSSVFKVNNAVVLHDASLLPENTNVYREIQISYSPYIPAWIVKIVTPMMNNLTQTNSSDDLPFDANQALDNPYALRDVYNSVAPTVKGALAYVLSMPANDGSLKLFTGTGIGHTDTRTFSTPNPAYSEISVGARIIGANVLTLQQTAPKVYQGTLQCHVSSTLTNRTLANRQVRLYLGENSYLNTDRILFSVPIASIAHSVYDGFGSVDFIYDKAYNFYLDGADEAVGHAVNATLQFDNAGYLSSLVIPVKVLPQEACSDNYYLACQNMRPLNAQYSPMLNEQEYEIEKHSTITPEWELPEIVTHMYPEAPIVQYFANRILTYTGDWAGYQGYQSTLYRYPTTTLEGRIKRCLKATDIALQTLCQSTGVSFETGALRDSIIYKLIEDYNSALTYIYYTLINPDTKHTYKKFPQALVFNIRSGMGASTQDCVATSAYVTQYPSSDNYNVPFSRLEQYNEYWRVL